MKKIALALVCISTGVIALEQPTPALSLQLATEMIGSKENPALIDASTQSELTFELDTDYIANVQLINTLYGKQKEYKFKLTKEKATREMFAKPAAENGTEKSSASPNESMGAVLEDPCPAETELEKSLKTAATESQVRQLLSNHAISSTCQAIYNQIEGKTKSQEFVFDLKQGYNYQLSVSKGDNVIANYEYKTELQEWYTHTGFTFIFSKDKRFHSVKQADASYSIARQGSDPDLNYAATVLFSYPLKETKFGNIAWSAGLGLSQESAIVLTGPSLLIGENFVINAGLVVSQFEQLKGVYSVGQNVGTTALDSSALTEKQYKIATGLTVGFRFE